MVKLWLDDVRPAPEGWVHAKTATEACDVMQSVVVSEASLDHDLGICPKCTPGQIEAAANLVIVQSLDSTCDRRRCACQCHATGYDFVLWCAAQNRWPAAKPRVHSANPVGAANMRAVIDRYWTRREPA